MKMSVFVLMIVTCIAGCKPAAPPENSLAAQRNAIKQVSEVGMQMQQQADQRLKSVDESK